jgi:hypothetical protein
VTDIKKERGGEVKSFNDYFENISITIWTIDPEDGGMFHQNVGIRFA